jgi:hypothetical protein
VDGLVVCDVMGGEFRVYRETEQIRDGAASPRPDITIRTIVFIISEGASVLSVMRLPSITDYSLLRLGFVYVLFSY